MKKRKRQERRALAKRGLAALATVYEDDDAGNLTDFLADVAHAAGIGALLRATALAVDHAINEDADL